MDAFWIILTGSLVAVACSTLGSFLILRKMAMIGDAISHAVLPGIVIAFLISGSRASLPMLVGAALVGLLTTFLIETFHNKAKLQTDASIGIAFTWLFALGIILISAFADQVDLDQDCVLYGEIAYVPLDLWVTQSGTNLGPRNVWIVGSALLIVSGIVWQGYKGFYLTTFDDSYAKSLGLSTQLWHYLLMGLVSLTTVVSFESVGAILVVAFLIGPAATAYLLTERFSSMLYLAAMSGILAAIGGYYMAAWLNVSIAGSMATIVGLEFLLAFLFGPNNGLVWYRGR